MRWGSRTAVTAAAGTPPALRVPRRSCPVTAPGASSSCCSWRVSCFGPRECMAAVTCVPEMADSSAVAPQSSTGSRRAVPPAATR